ncbi:MAG: hypothetical protein HYX46_09390 [Betaproteobacteria bacterium]|nr:hypothetical protein [Betaproteobacteria bacterium]
MNDVHARLRARPDTRALWIGVGALALLTVAMFFDALIAPGTRVLGDAQTDLAHYFLQSRDFGFGELAKGNLALWNPHIFAGVPFFGGMQSALLYPPNLLFLALPLPLAANWSIALNVWLLGTFMYLWALRRGLHPFAAFVSAALLMFCAPHFLHVHGGHVTLLAAMTWTPLLFLAIDEWLVSRSPVWCLFGMLAVGMQILAGSPQYVYFAAIAAGGYALLRLIEPVENRLEAAAGLLSLHAGGALLAAVQLLTGIQAAADTVRGQPLPFQFAASFGFPPENLVTLVAPGFFGDIVTQPYWGRWYLWEACAFIGVSGLALAAYGMATARMAGKWALLAVAAVALLLALGGYTPLFRVLFEWVPLFDKFRGTGKFIFPTALVLVLFAGYGLDRILRERAVPRRALWAAGTVTVVLCAGAAVVRMADWGAVTGAVFATGESYADAARSADPRFISAAQAFASQGLLIAALTVAATGALAWWAGRDPRAAVLLGVLAVAEVFAFARMHRPTFDSAQIVIPQLRDFLVANPGDYRILNLPFSNRAISMRAFDAWGYDPFVTRRYAEFIAWSEGEDPALAIEYVTFRRFHRLLSMLRVRYVVMVKDGVMTIVPGAVPPLRRLELIGSHRVLGNRAEVLRAMEEPSFDPRKVVILDRQPEPAPAGGETAGRATIAREGTDFIEIDADLPNPSILLVTDAWAPGWRAVARDGSSGNRYELMPANYALRAVALGRGKHRLRLEYAPSAFRIGATVSALACMVWLVAAFSVWRRGRKR